jgi:TatD DNase family protein
VIDTHAHLDPDEAEATLERARLAGVDRVITVGTTIEGNRRAVELASRYPGVFPCLGIHPHNAETEGPGRIPELRDLLRAGRAVGVGETGLDYFREYAPHDAQRRLFDAQLELAAELDLPVVIHTRAADADTLAALAGFEGTVVLHCFSSQALLEPALERGWYCSFAGNVTYPKAPELRAAAVRVPGDRVLAETDSPYLTPQAVRGQRNEPAFVMHTLAVLADARGESAPELEAAIDRNATAAFGL